MKATELSPLEVNDTQPALKSRLREWLLSFATSVFIVGAGILILPKLIFGDADPFSHGWPWCLQLLAFLLTFAVAIKWHHAIITGVGSIVGLFGFMLFWGQPEYPAMAAVAMTINVAGPSLLGTRSAIFTAGRFLDKP